MQIYLDDCSDDDDLVAFLQQAGHAVYTPPSEATSGSRDPNHLHVMPMPETVVRLASYRAATEDRSEVVHLGADVVLVVADGAGGRPDGAAAAEGIVRHARQSAPLIDRRDPNAWSRFLAELDGLLEREPDAGETTAVVLAISRDGIAGASVGDSEAWLIGAEGRSALTERQQPKPGLGTGMARPVAFRSRFAAGTLLVATDGLFKYADADAIGETARDPDLDTAASRLIALVRPSAGRLPDDVGLILCRSTA